MGTEASFPISADEAANLYVYFVDVTSAYGCTVQVSDTLRICEDPTVTIAIKPGEDTVVCAGGHTTLIATVEGGLGTPTYQWYKNGFAIAGASGSELVTDALYSNVAAVYTVSVSQTGIACTATSTQFNVTVYEAIEVALSTSSAVNCVGSNVTLTATTMNGVPGDVLNYQWFCNGVVINGANEAQYVTDNNFIAGHYEYQVEVSSNISGCHVAQSSNFSITVEDNPTVMISNGVNNNINTLNINYGDSTILTASGANNYCWNTGSTNASITINPITTTTYTVTGISQYGCTSTASVTVHITYAFDTIVCGAFWWNNQWYTTSGEYQQIFTSANGCDSIVTMALTVAPTYNVIETMTICSSELPYTWNGIQFNQAGTHSVTLTTISGCDSTVTMNLIVLEVPSISIIGNTTFCEGNSTILNAVGASNYVWSDGSTQSHITVSQSGTYTVTSTNDYSCSSTASVNVIAYPLPQIVINGNTTICEGESTILTASGAEQYLWNTGQQTASINVNSFGIYTVTGTSSIGCYNTASVVITVSPSPVIGITGNTDICQGESTTLTANGGVTYIWNNGSTNAALTVNTAGTYQVIATDENGCTNMASVIVNSWNSASSELYVTDTVCYFWDGIEYCTSGDYVQILQTSHGCDSVVTLHLTIIGTGINEHTMTAFMNVFPNPILDKVNVQIMMYNGQLDAAEIQLFDVYGKGLRTCKVAGENTVIDLSSYAAGIYIIKVVDNQRLIGVRKVLKISK